MRCQDGRDQKSSVTLEHLLNMSSRAVQSGCIEFPGPNDLYWVRPVEQVSTALRSPGIQDNDLTDSIPEGYHGCFPNSLTLPASSEPAATLEGVAHLTAVRPAWRVVLLAWNVFDSLKVLLIYRVQSLSASESPAQTFGHAITQPFKPMPLLFLP